MRQNLKRVGKRSLSIILSIMMIFSTMLVGMVTVNAANANVRIYFAYSGSYEVWPENWGGTENGFWYKAEAVTGETFEGKQLYVYNYFYDDSTGMNLHFKSGNDTKGDIQNIINQESITNYQDKVYVVNDSANGGEWKTYSEESGGDDDSSALAVSNNTLIVSYDKRSSNTWDSTHIWQDTSTVIVSGDNNTAGNMVTNVDGVSGLSYFDIPEDKVTANKAISFILKHGTAWNNNQYGDIVNDSFEKGKQWYGYNNGSTNTNAEYTPITLQSIENADTIVSETATSISVTPAGGLPYFLNQMNGPTKTYTLNVYEGTSASGEAIYTGTTTYAGEFEFNWIPDAVSTTSTVYLTFELKDAIDSITYQHPFTVTPPAKPKLTTPTISVDSTEIATGDSSYVTLTVNNHSSYTGGVTYHLYKDGTEYDKFTSSSYQLTECGTYTVKAVPSDTDTYAESDFSDSQTITKIFNINTGDSANGTINVTKTAANGTTVDVSVIPDADYNCKSITVTKADGTEVTPTGSGSSWSFTMPASDVTVSATFEEKPKVSYSVYFNGGETAMAESASQAGVYISEEKISGENFWFKIKKVSESTTKFSNAGNVTSAEVFSSADSTYTIGTWDNDSSTNKNAFSQDTKTSYYIVYNSNTGVLSLSSTSDAIVSVKVYAKHGTRTFVDNVYKGTYNYGTTVATAANSDSTVTLNSSQGGYNLYTVSEGSSVKVTTTINATYSSKYYVHAFVVNGISYDATADVGASYYAEFPVEAGVTNYEVTPIYYLNACKTEGEYIKFYVDASELTTDHGWGNTISSYSYCYIGDGTKAVEPDGSYPGQPMLFDKGQNRYYCLVPKSMDDHSITGVTVNNYKNDEVHSLVNSNLTTNEQSYDYNDFKYAYELGNDIIRFDMKPRSAANDNLSYVNGISNKTYTFSYNTFNVRNGWEAFKDNDGNNVDVLGFPVDPSNTNKLYVVSTAHHDVSGVGQWATKWYVYAADGDDGATLITYGLPSDFIPRSNPENNTDPYKAVLGYADGAYKNAYTEITFENRKDIDSANRLDGRWYYAQNDDEVTADVKYRTSEDGTTWSRLKEDASVAFINNATTTSITFEKHGETARLVAAPIVGYVFSGWGVVDKNGENYRDSDSNLGASFETVIDAEMHFVANYVKATEGDLFLTHSKYIGDDAKGANGYYKISARVQKEDGNWTDAVSGTGTGATGQKITLNNVSANDKLIEVTLTTVTAGENTFRYWYTQSINGFEIIEDLDAEMTYNGSPSTDLFGKSGTFTYTFYTDVSKLFANNKQIIHEFNYYSDIDAVTKDYVLTYNYDDRFGNPKSYVVKGTHNDEYYEANGNSWKVNQQLIYDNAPAIDDLYKDCIWKLVDETITYSGSSATIKAIQNEKTHEGTITIDNKKTPFKSVKHNTFLYADTEKETFYSAEGNNFLYWIVYEKGTLNEVAKCYTKDFALRIVDDYDIVAIFGEAEKEDSLTIGEATYTREQYTDSTGNVKSDYVYADFLVSFMSDEYIKLNSEAADSYPKYHTGIIVEMSQGSVLPDKLDFDKNGKVIYSDITFESDANAIMASATSGEPGLTKYKYNDTDSRKVYNFIIDNTKYNNYNRLDYYVKFNNTESNQKYVMKAYYYVYQTDENGSIIEGSYQITDCVYFNLYDIGKSDATIDMETT